MGMGDEDRWGRGDVGGGGGRWEVGGGKGTQWAIIY